MTGTEEAVRIIYDLIDRAVDDFHFVARYQNGYTEADVKTFEDNVTYAREWLNEFWEPAT